IIGTAYPLFNTPAACRNGSGGGKIKKENNIRYDPIAYCERDEMDSALPMLKEMMAIADSLEAGRRSVSCRPSLTPGGVGQTVDRFPTQTLLLHRILLFNSASSCRQWLWRGKIKKENNIRYDPTAYRERDEQQWLWIWQYVERMDHYTRYERDERLHLNHLQLPPSAPTTSTASNLTAITPAKETFANKVLPLLLLSPPQAQTLLPSRPPHNSHFPIFLLHNHSVAQPSSGSDTSPQPTSTPLPLPHLPPPQPPPHPLHQQAWGYQPDLHTTPTSPSSSSTTTLLLSLPQAQTLLPSRPPHNSHFPIFPPHNTLFINRLWGYQPDPHTTPTSPSSSSTTTLLLSLPQAQTLLPSRPPHHSHFPIFLLLNPFFINRLSDAKCVWCSTTQPKSSSRSMDSKPPPTNGAGMTMYSLSIVKI
ncbi:unnamed protein product, partial [Pleuronectes platessa]